MPDGLEFAFGSMGALVGLYLILPLFPLLYVVIRWRAQGSGEPGLGFHAGVLYLRAVAVLVLVTGLALLLHSVIGEEPGRRSMESLRRVGAGLLLGGVLVYGLQQLVLAGMRPGAGSPHAARVFHGFVLIVSGLVALATILLVCITIFQEDTGLKDLREPLAWVIVWTGCYLLHVRILRSGAEGSTS